MARAALLELRAVGRRGGERGVRRAVRGRRGGQRSNPRAVRDGSEAVGVPARERPRAAHGGHRPVRGARRHPHEPERRAVLRCAAATPHATLLTSLTTVSKLRARRLAARAARVQTGARAAVQHSWRHGVHAGVHRARQVRTS